MRIPDFQQICPGDWTDFIFRGVRDMVAADHAYTALLPSEAWQSSLFGPYCEETLWLVPRSWNTQEFSELDIKKQKNYYDYDLNVGKKSPFPDRDDSKSKENPKSGRIPILEVLEALKRWKRINNDEPLTVVER